MSRKDAKTRRWEDLQRATPRTPWKDRSSSVFSHPSRGSRDLITPNGSLRSRSPERRDRQSSRSRKKRRRSRKPSRDCSFTIAVTSQRKSSSRPNDGKKSAPAAMKEKRRVLPEANQCHRDWDAVPACADDLPQPVAAWLKNIRACVTAERKRLKVQNGFPIKQLRNQVQDLQKKLQGVSTERDKYAHKARKNDSFFRHQKSELKRAIGQNEVFQVIVNEKDAELQCVRKQKLALELRVEALEAVIAEQASRARVRCAVDPETAVVLVDHTKTTLHCDAGLASAVVPGAHCDDQHIVPLPLTRKVEVERDLQMPISLGKAEKQPSQQPTQLLFSTQANPATMPCRRHALRPQDPRRRKKIEKQTQHSQFHCNFATREKRKSAHSEFECDVSLVAAQTPSQSERLRGPRGLLYSLPTTSPNDKPPAHSYFSSENGSILAWSSQNVAKSQGVFAAPVSEPDQKTQVPHTNKQPSQGKRSQTAINQPNRLRAGSEIVATNVEHVLGSWDACGSWDDPIEIL